MNPSRLRSIGLAISCLLFALVSYALLGPTGGQLPDPLAVQWGFGGGATLCAPLLGFRVLVLVGLGVLLALQLRDHAAPKASDGLGWMVHSISLASFALGLIWSNLGAETCETAQLSWPALIAALGVSLGLSRTSRKLGNSTSQVAKTSVGLLEHESAVWFKQVYAPTKLMVAVVLLLGGVLAWGVPGKGRWIAAMMVLVVSLSFAWIRVYVSRSGVRVYYGFWPVALTRVPLSEIQRAHVEELNNPFAVGGWGYRGSLTLWKRATIFIRSGQALALELTRGRKLRITVDDASTAAGLINDLCDERGS